MSKVLSHQKVQKVTTLIKALMGFIPLLGGVPTHFERWYATVFYTMASEGVEISHIAESLLGDGKDAMEPAVNHFVKVGKAVVAETNWNKIPEQRKKEIVDAVGELGLSTDVQKTRINVILLELATNGKRVIFYSYRLTYSTLSGSLVHELLHGDWNELHSTPISSSTALEKSPAQLEAALVTFVQR